MCIYRLSYTSFIHTVWYFGLITQIWGLWWFPIRFPLQKSYFDSKVSLHTRGFDADSPAVVHWNLLFQIKSSFYWPKGLFLSKFFIACGQIWRPLTFNRWGARSRRPSSTLLYILLHFSPDYEDLITTSWVLFILLPTFHFPELHPNHVELL